MENKRFSYRLLTSINRPVHFTLCFLFFSSFTVPSVFAQKIIRNTPEPSMVLRIGIGAHQIVGNGATGGNISFNCEAPVGQHLSWTANFGILMNPIDLALPPDTRGSYQTRFSIQPDFRYYPTAVLRRFYIGGGLGIVAGQGRTYGISPNGKSKLNIFAEALTELKFGFQGILLDRYIWNAFTSSGLLLPLNGDKKIPIFQIGLQLGRKRFLSKKV
jgi:hypothetical protein